MRFGKIPLFLVALVFMKVSVLHSQTMKDADGNIYMSVNIGKQVWMSENLKTTRFNDGKPIQLVANDNAWKELKTPAYCWYKDDIKNKDVFGALYNWFAVNSKKLCPVGWHVSTDAEWEAMIDYIGGLSTAGDKLKEKGVAHWENYLSQATNDYDFTALPGGMRYFTGDFPLFGNTYAIWWTSTEFSEYQAVCRGLHDSSGMAFKASDNKRSGFSVRCIKD
jgi:uncharacterized protein (TIGR02145 family)